MQVVRITFLLAIVSLIEVSHGQCIRIRSGNGQQCNQPPCNQPPCNQPPCCQPSSCGQSCATCGTSIEDLTTLLAIVRALEEKEAPRSTINNAEEIILQLVNALVYATTQNVGCPKNGGGGGGGISAGGGINVGGNGGGISAGGGLNIGGNGGGISAGGGLNIGGKGGISAGGGLIDIGGSGSNGNVGGGSPPVSGTGSNCGHPGGCPTGTPIPIDHPDDGLITLDLLHGPDLEHLVRLGIAGKNIVDVGLGHDN